MEGLKAFLRQALGELYGPIMRAAKIVVPFFEPHSLHWLFIASTVIIALVFYTTTAAGDRPSSVRAFVAFLLPKRIFLHPSAILDYKFYVVNSLLLTLLRVGSWVGVLIAFLKITEGSRWLLQALLGPEPAPSAEMPISAQLLYTFLVLIVIDFSKFAAHYLQHKIPLLWEFHKVHHSAEVLTPISNYRIHPVDFLLEQLLVSIAAGALAGIFAYFYSGPVVELTILAIGVFHFVFFLQSNLRHSHIPLAFGRRTSCVLSSPFMHQVHHSAEQRHFEKNFALIFSLWDHLAGTNYVPHKHEQFKLGLPAEAGGDRGFHSLTALYLQPFAAAFRLGRRDIPGAASALPKQASFRTPPGHAPGPSNGASIGESNASEASSSPARPRKPVAPPWAQSQGAHQPNDSEPGDLRRKGQEHEARVARDGLDSRSPKDGEHAPA